MKDIIPCPNKYCRYYNKNEITRLENHNPIKTNCSKFRAVKGMLDSECYKNCVDDDGFRKCQVCNGEGYILCVKEKP